MPYIYVCIVLVYSLPVSLHTSDNVILHKRSHIIGSPTISGDPVHEKLQVSYGITPFDIHVILDTLQYYEYCGKR